MQEQVPSCDQTRFPVCVLCTEIIHNQDGYNVNEVVGLIPPDQGPGRWKVNHKDFRCNVSNTVPGSHFHGLRPQPRTAEWSRVLRTAIVVPLHHSGSPFGSKQFANRWTDVDLERFSCRRHMAPVPTEKMSNFTFLPRMPSLRISSRKAIPRSTKAMLPYSATKRATIFS